MKVEKLKLMLTQLRQVQNSADKIGEHALALLIQSAINEVNDILKAETAAKSD